MKRLTIKLFANICSAVILCAVLSVSAHALTISGSNVGIGTDSPEHPLDVVGNINASSFTGSGAGLTAISGANISVGTIGSSALGTGAVTSGKLGDNAVSPSNINFLGNVAIVAPAGGDYNNPATAMNAYATWCGTPSESNPCLLKIMPGLYNVTSGVQMQPYIDMEGSGENTTIIQGSIYGSSTGVVIGATYSEIRRVTVKNTEGAIQVRNAIYNSANSKITNVTAIASGGSTQNVGVYNSAGNPVMTNVTAEVSGPYPSTNYGVANITASPVMTNVTARASGTAMDNYGVYNYAYSSPIITNLSVEAWGAVENIGISIEQSSTARITNSVIKATTHTIENIDASMTFVGNTQLGGGGNVINSGGSILTCAGAYDESYLALNASCL